MSTDSPSLLALASNWYNTLRSISANESSNESDNQSIDSLSLTPPLTPSASVGARSLFRSINQSINQALSPISKHSIKRTINQAFNQQNEPNNRFETIDEGNEPPLRHRSSHRSINDSTDHPIKHSSRSISEHEQSDPNHQQAHQPSHQSSHQSDRLLPQVSYHRVVQPSLLSSEDQSINLRGLINLAIITLVVLTVRLMIENLIKYGWLIRMDLIDQLIDGLVDHSFNVPVLFGCLFLFTISPFTTYYIEQFSNDQLNHVVNRVNKQMIVHSTNQSNNQSFNFSTCQSIKHVANATHFIHIATIFLLPQYMVTQFELSFLVGLILMFDCLIMTMKLVSVAHYGHAIRTRLIKQLVEHSIEQSNKQPSEQPNTEASEPSDVLNDQPLQTPLEPIHITLGQLLYFTVAPTLVFQQHYPRSQRIRVRFLIRRLIEFFVLVLLQLVLIEQYIMPTIKNSMPHIDRSMNQSINQSPSSILENSLWFTERILKLSIPNGFFWLFMFYSVFHSYLNALGECLRFGDRLFYKDWWNCQSLDVYWRHWNLPVHAFIARHIYAPLLRANMSAERAQLVCFTVSALAHELLISVPLHQVRGYVFMGMMAQIPLISITKFLAKKLKSPVYGNCIFWISFLVLGQPTIVLLICYSLQQAGKVTELVPLTPLIAEFH